MKIEYAPGATPLDKEELEFLLLPLSTQGELNRAEKQAIFEAVLMARKSRKLKADILTISGLKSLHEKMFSPVWGWAGKFRTSEKNIGIAPHQIQTKLHELCENCTYRISSIDEDSWPEFAAMFHHALVSIHPFPNGNGRHARLATDVLSWRLKMPEPTWGRGDLVAVTAERTRYLDALRRADGGDFSSLKKFLFQ